MNKRSLWVLLLCVVLTAILLTACGGEDTAESSSTVSTTAPTNAPSALLPLDLRTLLSAEQVSTALGVTVGEAELYEMDTILCYRSEDMLSSVELAAQTGTREAYDVTVEMYPDAVQAPNMGEAAHWSEQTRTLLTCSRGYLLTMTVDKNDAAGDFNLITARHLMALVLEKLPAA